jgi:hypothetical protein
VKRIDVLPDDVLLEIFDFYVKTGREAWQSLVHVCRRWRILVFRSPRRLNLRLFCKPKALAPARDTLDVWPALPLVIKGSMIYSDTYVVALLGQSNRVCEVNLFDLVGWKLEEVLASMQVPFPELTYLQLRSQKHETLPAIPDSFLGGSAPRLRHFELFGIPFPGLPNLLLSATHLVELHLFRIPHSGYISPEAMAALLSASSNLRTLRLEFESPQSRPDRESRSLPPPERSILPALDSFHFTGVPIYLEDLVTRIDTPQLYYMNITSRYQFDFDTQRLAQFINCTPTLKALDVVQQLYNRAPIVTLLYRTSESRFDQLLILISCIEADWLSLSVEALHPLSTVEVLYMGYGCVDLVQNNDATLWLEHLLPFTAVKHLYVTGNFVPYLEGALRELVGDRITQLMPSLQNIFVEGQPSGLFQENTGQFVAARQLSGHPITISDWDRGSNPVPGWMRRNP